MNFKFDILKVIVSLVLGLLLGFTLFASAFGGGLINFSSLLRGLFITVIIYIIWSLFQKK